MNLIPESLIKVIGDANDKPIIGAIMAGTVRTEVALAGLSRFYPIKVWFSEPVTLLCRRHWVKEPDNRRAYITGKTGTELVVPKFFLHGEQLCYSTTRRARSGYFFHKLDKVVKYDIVLEARKKSFDSYEDFKKRFDLMFITEEEIQNLWNGQSSQHGGKYIPRDFHGMGPKGKKVMADFLRKFQGINTTPRDVYNDKGYLNVYRNAYSHMGRDISISHLYGNRYVWYASEIAGCGNGRYGLVVNKTTFLHLEDD